MDIQRRKQAQGYDVSTPKDVMDHLSALTEEHGVRVEYELAANNETVLALNISRTAEFDGQAAIDVMILAASCAVDAALAQVSHYNDDQPLKIRSQQIHQLQMLFKGMIADKYQATIDDAQTKLEIVSG